MAKTILFIFLRDFFFAFDILETDTKTLKSVNSLEFKVFKTYIWLVIVDLRATIDAV